MVEDISRKDKINKIQDKIQLVIGLTGPFKSGCTTTANYLEKRRGYYYVSISEKFIKPYAKTRKEMQDYGDNERKKNAVYFIDKIIDNIYSYYFEPELKQTQEPTHDESKKTEIVIECLRNHVEIEELHNIFQKNFFLIAIHAKTHIRYERYTINDPTGEIAEFDDLNERETEDFYLYGQQMRRCIELADVFLTNNSMIPAFENNFSQLLRENELSSYKKKHRDS